ncbi:MAG: BCD family MFS transporter [Chloroflexota bacterium]
MTIKRIQLGLIHVAVAITLVPINSTLNRIMINELAISALLVAILASLPYLFSPIQVAIGSFSDRHPIFGWKRTPYIAAGLLLCVIGVIAAPYIAFLIASQPVLGIISGVFAFGAWGMGYNLASVSYFSLATEISGKNGRSRTIAVMFFMMILGIIFTSMILGQLLETYSPEQLNFSFLLVGVAALIFGISGLVKLEPKQTSQEIDQAQGGENYTWGQMVKTITENKQATRFFFYLILLLTAILGQDILLEPYGAKAFGLSVQATTQITSIWGVFFLISLSLGAGLEKRIPKIVQARVGAWTGIFAFALIIFSSYLSSLVIFYAGVILLGFATGLATVSNLALMLDMTSVGSVGLFIGAWGMASALARLTGNMLSGTVNALANNSVFGYVIVFSLEISILLISLSILRQVDVSLFQTKAEQNLPFIERAVIANEG